MTLRREEQRLRSTFRRLIFLSLAAPGSLVSCGGHPSLAAVEGGAEGSSSEDAGDPQDSSFIGVDADFPPVAWCEAGPPSLLADGLCEYAETVPCGLPPEIEAGGDGVIESALCTRICLYDAGHPLPNYGCRVLLDAGPSDGRAEASVEAGAPGPGVTLECATCGGAGRRPAGFQPPARVGGGGDIGDFFAATAHLEAASVRAFEDLAVDLGRWGAPASLVHAARRSARDEILHARMTARLTRKYGGTLPLCLTPPPAVGPSLEELATLNAVEGCVRETFAALVATWQAANAEDAEVRVALTRIAADETRHAALASAVARWADAHLDDGARARVASAQWEAVRALRREAISPASKELQRVAGLPSPERRRRLMDGLARSRWAAPNLDPAA